MTSTLPPTREVRRTTGGLALLGILLVTAGVICIAMSFIATLAVVVVAGALLLAGGIIQIVQAVQNRSQRRPTAGIFLGILYGIVGLIFLARPALSAVGLTAVLACFFLIVGIARCYNALAERHERWGWVLASGIAAIILSVLVFASWPLTSFWLIGTLVGVEMIFAGVSLGIAAVAYGRLTAPVVREIERERRTVPRRGPPEPPAPMP